MNLLLYGFIFAGSLIANLFVQEVMEDDYNAVFESEYQKIQQAKIKLEKYKRYRDNQVNYKKLINEHYQSLRRADSLYQKKNHLNNKKDKLKSLADQLSNEINELKERISELDYFDKNLKDEKSSLIQMHKRTVEKIRNLNSEKNKYYQKVKENNRVTSQLKILIKETCGERGREWYYRNYTAKGRK
jgi:chromosome segregation ATPase